MFKIGDRVKALKWRDCGDTAETLYVGRIVRQEGDRFVIRIIRSKRGWKKGDEEWDVATNMVLSPKPTREQREVGYL